jgi:hypothetical protein
MAALEARIAQLEAERTNLLHSYPCSPAPANPDPRPNAPWSPPSIPTWPGPGDSPYPIITCAGPQSRTEGAHAAVSIANKA